MTRYKRAPREDPAEELALQLEEARYELPPAGLPPKQRRRWLRKREQRLVLGQISRGLTWRALADVLNKSEAQVREIYEPIVRRRFGTTRLTRRGPARVRRRTILMYHQKDDPTEVKAVVDPKGGEIPRAAEGWVPRIQFVDVQAADDEELFDIAAERLGVDHKSRPGDLERAIRSIGALQEALGVAYDWAPKDEYLMIEPYDDNQLASVVEAVFAVFGDEAGDLQKSVFGFGVVGGRRR